MLGFHKPAINEPDDYVFDVISMILGDGRTSRLYKKLVVDRQLAADVSVFDAPGGRYPNLLVVYSNPRAPHTVKELEDAILEELEQLKSEPVSGAGAATDSQQDRVRGGPPDGRQWRTGAQSDRV